MRKYLTLLLLPACFACDQTKKTQIAVPIMEDGFYQSAYLKVSDELESDPDDVDLIYQQLYYLNMMEWPANSLEDIRHAEKILGLSEKLVEYYISYYLKYHRYLEVREMISRWEIENKLTEFLHQSKVRALLEVSMKNEAAEAIGDYVHAFQGPDQFEFAARHYLSLGDTILAAFYFNKLYKDDPGHPIIIQHYVPILLNIGYARKAKEIILEQKQDRTPDFKSDLMLARSLYQLGEQNNARRVIRRWSESHPEAGFQLATWFVEENKWDSALYYSNELVQMDSTRDALFLKGNIFEKRGWLNSSKEIYDLLVARDTSDEESAERAMVVSQKLAYLRNLRESRRDTPNTDISSQSLETEDE